MNVAPGASLWFIVPAHGRVELARVCLAQLADACAVLSEKGIAASAVVIACDGNIDTAEDMGFGTVTRDNRQLGRKLNDGYELAGRTGVDYVAPFGSDDWIDPALLLTGELPAEDTIRCCRQSAVVSEDGTRLAPLRIPYDGGDGVRVIPTAMLAKHGYRPANEDGQRAMDTSVWMRLRPKLEYVDLHPLQIVDWKSEENLNSYTRCLDFLDGEESTDPFGDLAAFYAAEHVDAIRTLHGLVAA